MKDRAMLTVSTLGRACGVARSTVLYYESIGLLRPPRRSSGNYRVYGEADLARLRQIRVYRDSGLELDDIRAILAAPSSEAAGVLRRRLTEVGAAIERLRVHQTAIARLLHTTRKLGSIPMVTKQKWVEVMKKAGFKDEDMRRWHAEFERSAPSEHQEFLEFLHIGEEEIASIRKWSKEAKQ
jgi:MerR family transcriptional regulator, thiopeptide resistance regulator